MMDFYGEERAKYAFEVVSNIKESKDVNFALEFARVISRMASYILTNGLNNTLVFLYSKKKHPHTTVLLTIAYWIVKEMNLLSNEKLEKLNLSSILNGSVSPDVVIDVVKSFTTEIDVQTYMIVSEEVLKLVVWLKRLCDGIFEDYDLQVSNNSF
ncbi:MAG: type III-B CRISPR module-associated protein Cmr5 [Candidatus Aenigmarchaeota archaeon]|nr:type III-B CRISPR module-associated protein Cmr5 [Candidatus Aenigmarchaeota archaeon]